MAKRKKSLKVKSAKGALSFDPQHLAEHTAVASRSFGSFGGFTGYLPNPDPILKRLGRDIAVYRELLFDPIVGGHVRRRKASVASMEWRLLKDDVPPQIADSIESLLNSIDIYHLISDILEATLYGWQPIEIIWQRYGLWLPEKLIAKPQEWFNFNADGQLCFVGQNLSAAPVAEYKFLCPTQEASYTNPYGRGDLALVYWAVVFKRGGLKFWAEFTEKYGAPWLIGKEPRSNTPQDTNKLLDALEALLGNSVGTIPNDSSVDIHEASGKASSVDAYDSLIRYCRSEIAIALLGQDQTTEKDSTHASAKAGLEVTDDIRNSDARIVESSINQLIDWVCDLNFGDGIRPKFELYAEEQVDKALAERDEILTRCGAAFTPEYFRRTYNLEESDLMPASDAPHPRLFANFAEQNSTGDGGQIIDSLPPDSSDLNQQAESLTASLVTALKDGVQTETDVLDKLIAAYPNMDDRALQDELARLIFLSELVGRIEAREELKP